LVKGKKDLFTVGQLARRCGVTVRTLQYYDAIGLLVPSAFTEGGRRMYGRREIVRLQQILFFKSMGFSLEEIRDKLLPADSAEQLEWIFERQKQALVEQMAQIQKTVQQIEEAIHEIRLGKEVDVSRLFAIMGAARMGNPYSFMIRHLNKGHVEQFLNRFEDEDAAAEINRNLQLLHAEMVELSRRNADPEGKEAQALAARLWQLVTRVAKDDPALIQNIFAIGASGIDWPSDDKGQGEVVKSFIERAFAAYFRNNGIKLPFMEEKQ